jgi:flagellar motor component MotA
MKTPTKKILSLVLCSLMIAGISGGVSEAHYRDDCPRYEHHHHHHYESEGHSEGEVITAGIVGTVLGVIIANNT